MKKRIIRIFIFLLVVSGCFSLNSIESYAGNRYCCISGCSNKAVDSRTKYCADHKCAVGNCDYQRMGTKGIEYCTGHYHSKGAAVTCAKRGCDRKTVKSSKYCSAHTCQRGDLGCYNMVDGANEKCQSCKAKAKEEEKNKKSKGKKGKTYGGSTSSSKDKSSSKKKKPQMPDCDDYEDYDDFMDEWDGRMPDGSDAEDYWENW